MGTPGPVQARATPLQSRTGPVRDCPWFHPMVDHTNFARASIAQLNPIRDLSGHAQLQPMVSQDFYSPGRAPCGICTGDHGASRACPYGAHSNPGACPVKSRDRPRTGFDRALWACLIKSRGRYLGMVHILSCAREMRSPMFSPHM